MTENVIYASEGSSDGSPSYPLLFVRIRGVETNNSSPTSESEEPKLFTDKANFA